MCFTVVFIDYSPTIMLKIFLKAYKDMKVDNRNDMPYKIRPHDTIKERAFQKSIKGKITGLYQVFP